MNLLTDYWKINNKMNEILNAVPSCESNLPFSDNLITNLWYWHGEVAIEIQFIIDGRTMMLFSIYVLIR